MAINLHPFLPDTVIRVNGDPLELGMALEREVQAIWETEQAKRENALFNGRLFSVQDLTKNQIIGRFVEYRLLVAQRIKPELYEALGVRPLAVSGLLRNASGVVFGRRHASMTQDGGLWELVPSGGIDPSHGDDGGRIDVVGQLLSELQDEIGLDAGMVSEFTPFCLVEDMESHVFDLGVELITPLGADAILRRHRRCGSNEYVELEFVPFPEIQDFLTRNKGRLVAVSRLLLEERGLSPAA